MKKLIEAIKKLFGKSDKPSSDSSSGFTLIELLVVIAVIGVLAAAVLLAVDPVDRLNAANDSRSITAVTQIADAMDAYAVNHDGTYPATTALMVTSGDLRSNPVFPTGYTLTYAATGLSVPLKSKKYTSTPFYKFEVSTGKKCAVATVATACP